MVPIAIVNGYATLEELQSWNEATKAKNVGVLERAIEACSRGIDRYTRRTFFQATGTRLFDAQWVEERGCWVQVVNFGEFNDLETIVSLKTDDDRDGIFETTWAPADYQLFPLNPTAGPVQRPYERLRAVGTKTFPEASPTGRVGLVQIDGNPWGWPAIPHDINQACLIHAARIFYRKETPHGVAGWGAFGEIRVGRTDPDVIAFLDPFQRYGGAGIA